MRAPALLTLTTTGIPRQLAVTEDGMSRFPGKLPAGESYAVTVERPCGIAGGSGTLTADVTVRLFCPGVVELAGAAFSFPSAGSPAFDPGARNYVVTRPYLLESDDLIQIRPTAVYPGDASIFVYDSASETVSGALSVAHTVDAGPVIRLEHPALDTSTYVFATSAPSLAQEAYIKSMNTTSNARFSSGEPARGNGVSLSGNTIIGQTLVVGAPNEDGFAGAVYVYRREAFTWVHEATVKPEVVIANAQFGTSVAIAGDLLIVGAPTENTEAGGAYIFARSGTTWSQVTRLQTTTPVATNLFGLSVAISGTTAIVGSMQEDLPGNTTDAGAAYVFVQNGASWSLQQRLTAGNADAFDLFGRSVAISGDTCVVGAPNENGSATSTIGSPNETAPNAGAAYVFTRSGTVWSLQKYVKASNAAADDTFGNSVSIDNDRLAVGAVGRDGALSSIGAAYVFARTGAIWDEDVMLSPIAPAAGDNFGHSVAIERNHLVVGVHGDQSAARGIDGVHNTGAVSAGAAYVFRRTASGWNDFHYIKASNTGANDRFGGSVAIAGDTFAIGAHGEDSDGVGIAGVAPSDPNESSPNSGAVYVFR
jgi:hypothetical protein